MSLKVITWVLEESGVYEHGDFRLLIALADRAHDDGTATYPALSWLAERMNRSERTVLRGLERLKESGILELGDQDLVSHFRPDRRPVVYDIVMTERGDTSDNGVSLLTERGVTSVHNGVTSGVIQTVPSSSLRSEETRPGGRAAAKKSRGCRLPEGWEPPTGTIEWARSRYPHLDLRLIHEVFTNYWMSASGSNAIKVNWDRAWRNWVIKDGEDSKPSKTISRGNTETAVAGWLALGVDPAEAQR